MCGIVGLIAKRKWGFYNSHANLLRGMIYADTIRGADSTGVFGITKNGNVTILKSILPGYEFIRLKEFDRFHSSMIKNYSVAIGHNRKATKGDIKPENAHPFNEGHITLVHNGMVWGHESKEFEVDSHALTADIARKGEMETLRDFRGAYAIVWYDKQRQRICLSRNNDRPLFLLEARDAWIVSSEHGIPSWLANRENYDSIGISSIKSVTPDYILSLNLEEDDRNKWRVQKIERVTTFMPPVVRHVEHPIDVSGLSEDKDDKDEATVVPAPVRSNNVRNIADLGSYSITDKYAEFEKGQEIVVRPYDYTDAGMTVGTERIMCDVMCLDGTPFPGVIAYMYAQKDDIEHYVSNKDGEYFRAKIQNFRIPKSAKSNLDVIIQMDMAYANKPKIIECAMSKNKMFTCRDIFQASTVTGCRTCQKPLNWANIDKIDVVRDDMSGQRKFRFLCPECTSKLDELPAQPRKEAAANG